MRNVSRETDTACTGTDAGLFGVIFCEVGMVGGRGGCGYGGDGDGEDESG